MHVLCWVFVARSGLNALPCVGHATTAWSWRMRSSRCCRPGYDSGRFARTRFSLLLATSSQATALSRLSLYLICNATQFALCTSHVSSSVLNSGLRGQLIPSDPFSLWRLLFVFQCLKRYHVTKQGWPHLGNAGKYLVTFVSSFFSGSLPVLFETAIL